MYSFQSQMPAASSLFTAYASLSASVMLIRSIFNELIPIPIRDYLFTLFHHLFNRRPKKLTLVIEENSADGIGRNQVYDAAEVYLSSKLTSPSTDRLKISKSPKDNFLTIKFNKGETINDSFEGIPLCWRFVCIDPKKRRSGSDDDETWDTETRFFELTLEKEFKDKVINSYLPYIISKYNSVLEGKRTLKLCTLGRSFGPGSGFGYPGSAYWDTVNLDHPFTFDTLAMDPDQKSAIVEDLDRFVRRREFYRKVGRAWKRGYLLYGPPGTGKSSLIAAMANYLRFDIYDLQLGNWMKDSDLRRLLLATGNRSILVIEDIDCSVDMKDRNQFGPNRAEPKPKEVQLTLSGFLNFIDGLWSSCGDERIIVFTTNHKEKLDPALLRPGRMDMHIHMSYLTVHGFRILASNYLEIKGKHPFFGEIETLIETVNVTPAQVAEELMRTEDVDKALQGVLQLLKSRKEIMGNGNDDAVKAKAVNGISD